jgi:hypothetical protein
MRVVTSETLRRELEAVEGEIEDLRETGYRVEDDFRLARARG